MTRVARGLLAALVVAHSGVALAVCVPPERITLGEGVVADKQALIAWND